eukprot:6184788-Pleurochrysis_carterae.AAC.2
MNACRKRRTFKVGGCRQPAHLVSAERSHSLPSHQHWLLVRTGETWSPARRTQLRRSHASASACVRALVATSVRARVRGAGRGVPASERLKWPWHEPMNASASSSLTKLLRDEVTN